MSYFPVTRELVALANSEQVWAVIHVDYESKTAELVTVTGPPKKMTVSFGRLIPAYQRFADPNERTAA